MNTRKIVIITTTLLLILIPAYASILIETGSYGEIFPANNGDMHMFIRNDNSSYIFYSGGRVVKETPLGVSDSTIIFETASSDGVGGVYVLYNNTSNKTIYAQRYNSNGEALWDAPGSVVYNYLYPRVSSFSVLGPDSSFIVVYDDYFPVYVTPEAYLWAISQNGDVTIHQQAGRFSHSWNFEIHSNPYEVYIKQALNSYIASIYNFTGIYWYSPPPDTSKLGILEFDCDKNGYIYAMRTPAEFPSKRSLQRYDNQLNAIWENPIEYHVESLFKSLSEPDVDRPEIIANHDGSVTLYPSTYSIDWNFSRIDSSREFIYNDLELIGERDRVKAALSCSDGANLFLVNEWDNDRMSLMKVTIDGNIEFSSILKNGSCRYAKIIENTDSTYATTMITSSDSVFVDKITNTGDIMVSIDKISSPNQFTLSQNYPNPFNPTTIISYDIKEASYVKLNIYTIGGQLVQILADEYHRSGAYKIKWDASSLSSGIYIYRLEYDDQHISRKMVLMK